MKETIWHGSEKIIKAPVFGFGPAKNDYGRGFYCTQSVELAKEWACKKGTNGFANAYELETDGLRVCNLNSEEYTILHWLALLTRYRGYWQRHTIAEEAKNFLQENYRIDTEPYDVIIGYRADDSYFSFAQDFIAGTISLQKLSKAMQLGKLGEQIMLKSGKAFEQVNWISCENAFADEYYVKKCWRDLDARRAYVAEKAGRPEKDQIYMLDIMRGNVDVRTLRLQ